MLSCLVYIYVSFKVFVCIVVSYIACMVIAVMNICGHLMCICCTVYLLHGVFVVLGIGCTVYLFYCVLCICCTVCCVFVVLCVLMFLL
jgi:hypothetical protein